MPFAMHNSIAFIVLLLAAVLGIGSLVAFFVFLYSGSFNWVKLDITEIQGMMLNTLLSCFFFVQHSGMVRRSFRRRLAFFVPTYYQGATYTIMSGLVLIVFLVFWQGSDNVLFEAQGLAEIIMRGFFLLAVLGTLWGMWALGSADLFGFDAVIRHNRTDSHVAKVFTIRGPYRWVRHPLYLFTLVFFWSYPVITTDRLLFNILWTLWVAAGARLEERELVADFGDDYRDYQAKVPMLLPCSIRSVWRD